MKSIIKYKREQLPSLFDSFEKEIERFFTSDYEDEFFPSVFTSKFSFPKSDISETEDKFIIEAAVPGLSKDDIKIEIKDYEDGKYLSLSGKKSQSIEEDKKNYIHKEIKHSSFSRTFPLGDNVKDTDIVATFKEGMLTIEVPKKEKTITKNKIRQIEIR